LLEGPYFLSLKSSFFYLFLIMLLYLPGFKIVFWLRDYFLERYYTYLVEYQKTNTSFCLQSLSCSQWVLLYFSVGIKITGILSLRTKQFTTEINMRRWVINAQDDRGRGIPRHWGQRDIPGACLGVIRPVHLSDVTKCQCAGGPWNTWGVRGWSLGKFV
jgi:hypothetical protein